MNSVVPGLLLPEQAHMKMQLQAVIQNISDEGCQRLFARSDLGT